MGVNLWPAQVVDNETGITIKGAYWRSETLDGETLVELAEGGEHVHYVLGLGSGTLHSRVTNAAMLTANAADLDWGSASEDFRVIVAKEGYTTIVRQLTATGNLCFVMDVEGDREFRLIK